jgi:hypothetical protein
MSIISSDELAGIASAMVGMAHTESIKREREIFARLIRDKTYMGLLYKCRKLIDDGMKLSAEYTKAKKALDCYCDKAFSE